MRRRCVVENTLSRIYIAVERIYHTNMTRIAIIEDDQVISQMYIMKFTSEGYDVQWAENGKLGVEMVKDIRPDLILLDLHIPVMDGAEALREIRKHDWGKNIPVIVLTNLGKEEAPKELESLGIHSYIVKADLTPRQVVERVKEALKQ